MIQGHDSAGGEVWQMTAHKSTGSGKPVLRCIKGYYYCGYREDHPMWWAGPVDTPKEAYALWKRTQPTGRAPCK